MTETKEWVSWNENIRHSFKEKYVIETESQFCKAISESENVRFYGNKQSSADICAGTETLIDISNFNKIINFNKNKKQITVQSGIKLSEFLEFLETENLCIPCLPDINTITLGGALATGTHGTSGSLLAAYMIECRLILANGDIKTIIESDELMDAVRVSVGVLGAFSTITLQCEDKFILHLKEAPEKDNIWLTNLDKYLKEFDFLRILWIPHSGSGYVIKGKKVEDSLQINENLGPKYLKHRRNVSKLLYKYSHKLPWTTFFANNILSKVFFSSKKEHKGSLYEATVTKSRGSTLELAEWSISLEQFPAAFKELKDTINSFSNKSFIHIPMDIRFVKPDSSWLSNAYQQNTVTMGCVARNAANADSYEAFKTIETIFLKYGGRPHWGKRFSAKNETFKNIYPQWEKFKTLRKEMDPNNKFLNTYLANVFAEKKLNL